MGTVILESQINEYVTLTGEARDEVIDRFRRITKQRRWCLLLGAKGLCHKCKGKLIWLGEGKACLCHKSRGPRRRHWVGRLISRLQNDEGMSTKEVRLAMKGKSFAAPRAKKGLAVPRAKKVVPVDFRVRCLTVGGVGLLAAHYGVSTAVVYHWIKSLKLKRKIIYVDNGEAATESEPAQAGRNVEGQRVRCVRCRVRVEIVLPGGICLACRTRETMGVQS
jgi:hypothetical protein